MSSYAVLEKAEQVAQKILDTYSEPDKSFVELRAMINDHTIDLLHDFSQACRIEQDFPEKGALSRMARTATDLSPGEDIASLLRLRERNSSAG
ncbi:hypothetical protein [Bradyrhizobium sp. DASA03120]|uniref:hypothetical protein n=1 Tax=Bradyrhizobium sp. SMVTL-02 TaxID=3395917 RepID=UPI003F71608A